MYYYDTMSKFNLKSLYFVFLHLVLIILLFGIAYHRVVIRSLGFGVFFGVFLVVEYLLVPWLWSVSLTIPDLKKFIMRDGGSEFLQTSKYFFPMQLLLQILFWRIVVPVFSPEFLSTTIFGLPHLLMKVSIAVVVIGALLGGGIILFKSKRAAHFNVAIVKYLFFSLIIACVIGCGSYIVFVNFTPYTTTFLGFLITSVVILATIDVALLHFARKTSTLYWRIMVGFIATLVLIHWLSRVL